MKKKKDFKKHRDNVIPGLRFTTWKIGTRRYIEVTHLKSKKGLLTATLLAGGVKLVEVYSEVRSMPEFKGVDWMAPEKDLCLSTAWKARTKLKNIIEGEKCE